MLARTFVIALLAAGSLALIPVASGATTLTGRYARCSDPHPKTYTTCPDVLTLTSQKVADIQFKVKKKYCSANDLAPGEPGVWALYNGLKIHNGRISGSLDYNNYSADNQGAPDDIGVSFRWTGKVVSGKLLHLVLTGKVTSAGSDVADCAGVSFTETHDLKAVGF